MMTNMHVVFSVLGMERGQPGELLLRHRDPGQGSQDYGEAAVRGDRPR